MRVARAETALYRVPIGRPAVDAIHGVMEHVELITVDVETDDGAAGHGYAYTIGHGGSAVLELVRAELLPVVLGQDPTEIERLWEQMYWRVHWVGRGGVAAFALAAVDTALWDLLARRAGLPLARLLGACRDRVPAYGSGVDLHLSADEVVAEVRRFAEAGFGAVKIKVGRERFAEDLERVAAVRDALGSDLRLMVDANMRWTVAEAIQKIRRLEPYGPYWVEEPTLPDDPAGHARIARAVSVPLAAGESLHSRYEYRPYLESGALGVVQIDVITVGGITEFRKIAAAAALWNLPVSTHYAQEISVHLLASLPNGSYAEQHAYNLDRYLKRPLVVRDGAFLVPEEPGHGLEFDRDRLAPYRIDR